MKKSSILWLKDHRQSSWRTHGAFRLFSPLAYSNYRLLWAGRNFSRLGDSVYEIALGWTVYKLTGSSVAMGIVLATFTIAQVVFGFAGGVFGDRMSRRQILLTTDIVAGVITAFLALSLMTNQVNLSFLVVAAAGLGIASAFAMPALSPLLGEMVSRDDLQSANALDSATFSFMTLAGPALGGMIVAYSAAFAFAFDAVTFFVSFLAMKSLRYQRKMVSFENVKLGDLAEGFRYAARHSWLMWLVAASIVANVVCIAPFYVLLPMRVSAFHLGASSYGLALAAQGITSVIASATIGYMKRVRHIGILLFVSASSLGIAPLILALAQSQFSIVLAGGVIGFSTCATMMGNYLIQSRIDLTYQSRIMGMMMTGAFALLPLAYAGSGFLSAAIGAPTVLIVGGTLQLLFCVAALCTPSIRQLQESTPHHAVEEIQE